MAFLLQAVGSHGRVSSRGADRCWVRERARGRTAVERQRASWAKAEAGSMDDRGRHPGRPHTGVAIAEPLSISAVGGHVPSMARIPNFSRAVGNWNLWAK